MDAYRCQSRPHEPVIVRRSTLRAPATQRAQQSAAARVHRPRPCRKSPLGQQGLLFHVIALRPRRAGICRQMHPSSVIWKPCMTEIYIHFRCAYLPATSTLATTHAFSSVLGTTTDDLMSRQQPTAPLELPEKPRFKPPTKCPRTFPCV